MPHLEIVSQEMKDCAETCNECSVSCIETVAHCLEKGGEHAKRDHITLLQICADICQVSARAMLFGSKFHEYICRACAEICEACAENCASLEDNACAEVCRRCASSCRKMSGGTDQERLTA